MNLIHIRAVLALAGLACFLVASSTEVSAQSLKAEDVIAKHIESIGSQESRAKIKNRMAVGTSLFESKLPAKSTSGKAVIASDPANLMFLTSFSSQEYPFEKIGYFNGKVSLPWVTAGARSPLGAFLADHSKVLSQGLLAGSISENWTLLSLADPQAVKTLGIKRIDGKRLYILEYSPKGLGGTEFSIRLFFDAETFRHVRTEYRDQINPSQDTFGQLGRQAGVTIQMIETFDEFKSSDGLTLPYLYRIQYLTNSNSGVYEFTWTVKIQAYRINENLAANFFSFDEH